MIYFKKHPRLTTLLVGVLFLLLFVVFRFIGIIPNLILNIIFYMGVILIGICLGMEYFKK